MTPQKLFDYLDGKLPAPERAALEEKLASDPILQEELILARRLRSRMGDIPEVIIPDPHAGGALIGRRVALAAIVLVFVNVVFGLFVIFQHERKTAARSQTQSEMRQQLHAALERAAAAAMPTPNLEADEITISAPPAGEAATVQQLIEAARAAGGSAAKALDDESSSVVLVDIPQGGEAVFRQRMSAMGAKVSPPQSRAAPAPNERRFLQVRVHKTGSSPAP